jgi:hypothetical protein
MTTICRLIVRAMGLAVLALVLSGLITGPTTPNRVAASGQGDWEAVEDALGKAGQMQPGAVFRVSMPRSDLQVTVHGLQVDPTFALGSYAAFKDIGRSTMVMGDLVLLDEEVNPVMAGLFAGGIEITALHNHLNDVSPHVMYLHFMGHGNPVQLATTLANALAASGTPIGPRIDPGIGSRVAAASRATRTQPPIATEPIERILARSGRLMESGVLQFSVPRAERISDMNMDMDIELLPAMGVATVLNFQATDGGRAAITGDFVLLAQEVNPVAQMLKTAGIDIEALHQHGLGDEPRLFYMHFWAQDDALRLATGLRAALDQTNSAP